MEEKRIIEVNGVKMEVDMRHAKIIENFKVGDNVKVLKKEYGDSYKVYPGVIVDFDEFPTLPTITIAYLDKDYSNADVKFMFFNPNSKDVEIVMMPEAERVINKADALQMLDSQIQKKEEELREMKYKRNYFIENFEKYFEGQFKSEGADNVQ